MNSNLLLLISVLVVGVILISINYTSMQSFTTYVIPIQNIKLLEKSAHVDLVKLPDVQEGPIPLKNFEYMDDGSITVTFGGGGSPTYPDIPNFSYVQNFQVNQTFAFRCLEKDNSTFLGFYKYLGTTTVLDDEYLLLWHFEGETQKQLPCNYPDVIINSVDVVDAEPKKNYLDKIHRQHGLEKNKSIESDEQPSKPVINPEKCGQGTTLQDGICVQEYTNTNSSNWTTSYPKIIQPPLKQIQSGIPFNEIQCKQNLVLIQKYDGSPACVTESTKLKLIERGWTKSQTTNLALNDNESWGYVKNISILDQDRIEVTMSYPTNIASHELYPNEYQSIVGDCDTENNFANLSLLYLKNIDSEQMQVEFIKENKVSEGLQCDEAFWQEMTERGYCGPPHPLIFNEDKVMPSIKDAQKRTDFMINIPQYLPDKYSIQKITVEPDDISVLLYASHKPISNEMSSCEFTWDDEGIFLFYEKSSQNFDWKEHFAKNAKDPKKRLVNINGNDGYVENRWVGDRFGMPIPQQSKVVLYMQNENKIFEIHSSLDSKELVKVAESLQ